MRQFGGDLVAAAVWKKSTISINTYVPFLPSVPWYNIPMETALFETLLAAAYLLVITETTAQMMAYFGTTPRGDRLLDP